MSKKPAIASIKYGQQFPNRVNVWTYAGGVWAVSKGHGWLQDFPTHAEAIAYADLVARRDV